MLAGSWRTSCSRQTNRDAHEPHSWYHPEEGMIRACRKYFLLFLSWSALCGTHTSYGQTTPTVDNIRRSSSASQIDTLQSLTEYILQHLPQTTPKKLVHQMQVRNRFHRRGYPEVLSNVLRQDGLGALVAYFKMRLHVEFSMVHDVFWIIEPDPGTGVEGIAFPDNRDIPRDPWKHEWWFKE